MNHNGRTTDDPKEKTYRFRCNDRLSQDIEILSKKKGLSVSEYIRNAVIEYNKKWN